MPVSSKIANILWWMVYCAAGLTLQRYFSGVDALIPGIILSCQENRPRQTGLLCLAVILVQEGTGSLAFGDAILWYGSLIFFFSLGKLFFVTSSLFFVVLISLLLGVAHPAILYVTSSLQGLDTNTYRLAGQAVAQALIIPPLYAAASLVRKRFIDHEYGI